MNIDILNLVSLKPLLPKGWSIKYNPQFLLYRPTFKIHIETSKYILKTADQLSELMNAFELRHQIFLEEVDCHKNQDSYDTDKFDTICDHLIIVDKETEHIVGTYRVLSTSFTDEFYSEEEFHLKDFLSLPGEKMELGRACIHHGHRNGVVIDLLWKGICRYIKLTNSKYLFGCSSVKSTEQAEVQVLFDYLKSENLLKGEHHIKSIGKYAMTMDLENGEENESEEKRAFAKKVLPPLLRSYFTAGAFVYGTPALDVDFKCTDFLTILDVENMSAAYKKRYMGEA